MPEGTEGTATLDPAVGAASGSSASTGSSSTASTSTGSGTTPPKWEESAQYKGMLSDVQKERKARQDFERKVADFESRLNERDRQIQALTGSRTPTKAEADDEAIRERLAQLSPASRLTEEQIADLLELRDQRQEMAATVDQHWLRHSRGMLDSLVKEVSAEFGDLTDRQKKKMFAAYVQNAESDPEFHRRHDAGDPALVTQFAKEWIEDFVEPVRRKQTANEVSRLRNVPNGRDRSTPMNGEKPIDYKDDKAVMDYIMKNRQGRFAK